MRGTERGPGGGLRVRFGRFAGGRHMGCVQFGGSEAIYVRTHSITCESLRQPILELVYTQMRFKHVFYTNLGVQNGDLCFQDAPTDKRDNSFTGTSALAEMLPCRPR